MAQPYVGEVRMFAGNFAPVGWMFCNGQLLELDLYPELFNMIGTNYGGDGETTFALPDLQGRLPIHQGNGFVLAERGGVEEITLSVNQIPAHNHPFLGSTNSANDANASANTVAQANSFFPYLNTAPAVTMAAGSIGSVGGSQPHTNFQPYLCVDFIISLFGIFPNSS